MKRFKNFVFYSFVIIGFVIVLLYVYGHRLCKSDIQISNRPRAPCEVDIGRELSFEYTYHIQHIEIGMAVDDVAVADCNFSDFVQMFGHLAGVKDLDKFRIRFLDGDLTKNGFERK